MKKSEARRCGLAARKALSQEQKEILEEQIFQRVIRFLEPYHCIAAYASLKEEVSTDKILQWCLDTGRMLLLPRTCENRLQFLPVYRLDELVEGHYHVRQPKNGACVDIHACDVMLVPLSAVDEEGNRTGYGKGYYDSVLSDVSVKVGLCFEAQIMDHIEADPWDVPLDLILTEADLYEVKRKI